MRSQKWTYLFVSPKHSGGGEAFESGARIPVALAPYPTQTDTNGHTTTALVIKEGALADVGRGEAFRNPTHPAKVCVRDTSFSSSINSPWTISLG